jgi:hypothetical protein
MVSRSTRRPVAPLPASASQVQLWVATRKGAWTLRAGADRQAWRLEGPHFLGHTLHHIVQDPRDPLHVLAAARTGHLGPTIFRSRDGGRTWAEATRPPAFGKARRGLKARVVDHTFFLTPGHSSESGTWWAGTAPQGLFFSDDGGDTWTSLPSVNDSAVFRPWMGSEKDGTPDGPKLHSILVDPRDPAHLMFGMSGGGVHESFDRGLSWRTRIEGLDVVAGFPTDSPMFHDPHCIVRCPSDPTRLYQQNHCGIYRLDEDQPTWVRIGRKMPKSVGDSGFPIVAHPRNADVAWVFPMDGRDVWPRTAIAGKPAAYITRNAGRTWQRQDVGLPTEQAWWTIKRQAMVADACEAVGLYVGTSSGEIWMSPDEGANWQCIARHLPEVYALSVGQAA